MIARRRTLLAVGAFALAGYVATGLTAVPRDEVGVVRRFGVALREPWPPGLHLGGPWGVDRVDRLAVDRPHTIEVGTTALASGRDDYITGDANQVSARAKVQYRVVRPDQYLFAAGSADAALTSLAESALLRAVAGRGVDDLLTTGRGEASAFVHEQTQRGADAQGLGVLIRSVELVRVEPPAAVAPAFADAARAGAERRQSATAAQAYRDRALADAHGQARETLDRATARADTLVQTARGEADRFTKLLRATRRDPLAAKRRMYLDTLTELLPKFERKVIVPSGEDVDLSVIAGP